MAGPLVHSLKAQLQWNAKRLSQVHLATSLMPHNPESPGGHRNNEAPFAFSSWEPWGLYSHFLFEQKIHMLAKIMNGKWNKEGRMEGRKGRKEERNKQTRTKMDVLTQSSIFQWSDLDCKSNLCLQHFRLEYNYKWHQIICSTDCQVWESWPQQRFHRPQSSESCSKLQVSGLFDCPLSLWWFWWFFK